MLPRLKQIHLPLLRFIANSGGSAAPKDVYGPLAKEFKLTKADLAQTCGGDSKWQALVRGSRDELVVKGLIHPAKGEYRGRWQLTDAGRKEAGR